MESTWHWQTMSPTRKKYFVRLLGRILILLVCVYMALSEPSAYGILEGGAFFEKPSWLHALWIVWVIDMLLQLIPVRHRVPLGSQKLFKLRFKPIRDKINPQALKHYVVTTTRSAYRVMILWVMLVALIGFLKFRGVLNNTGLFLISAAFYVCDLICVLIWCPFRLMMKTRCCTTYRIFNWDHLMMFSPMIFVSGFYSWSLFLMALAVFLVWEGCIFLYPERFWEQTNLALRCSNCTDKLCTQYCQKLRQRPS